MKRSGLSEEFVATVKRLGFFRQTRSRACEVLPLGEMDLILFIALSLVGCAFLLYALFRRAQDSGGKKTRQRSERGASSPTLALVVKAGNGSQTADVITTRRRGTGRLPLSKQSVAQSEVRDSKMIVRRRLVQVFATRMEPGREK